MVEDTLTADLRDESASLCGQLVVAQLPRGSTLHSLPDGVLALREGCIYRYEIQGIACGVTLEPSELFEPDDQSGLRGRLRPGQSVGRLVVAVEAADGRQLRGAVDVASAKLEQTREYRQMLEDIADHAAEAVLQGFAPTVIDLAPSDVPAELLYQRFAVLEARLQSDEFVAAVGRILHQPDRGWKPETQLRPAGTSYPNGSAFSRAVAAPGPRQRWLGGRGPLATLPRHLALERQDETVDTLPNRFVKYALERWREVAAQLVDVLDESARSTTPGPVRRGRAAAESVVAQLDELLGHAIFREVGRLTGLPTSNQVLLKREGYRQIFRTFALVEAGLALAFDYPELDDVYSASQRNVATLYEFWCYLVLAEALGRVCGEMKTTHAFVPSGDGLSLTMRAGRTSAIRWEVSRHGRFLEVELFFNRQFSVVRGIGSRDGSWTRAMRPDCSLRIRPVTALPREARDSLDVWIHFDAKYRIERLAEQLAPQPSAEECAEAAEAEEIESHSRSKREDLLKMHAYRDAIHRTAGAYVLYPGDEPVRVERFTELLPGLGAFPLRPGTGSPARGAEDLEAFVDDVLTHISQQASQHERSRFWSSAINVGGPRTPQGLAPAPFLDRPPADTDVLLGYVRSSQQRAWIERRQSYNVRADDRAGSVELSSRELSAELLLLYEQAATGFRIVTLARVGYWRAVARDELISSGYPRPGGRLYFVTTFVPVVGMPPWLNRVNLEALRPHGARPGAPFVVTWWDLLRSTPGLD